MTTYIEVVTPASRETIYFSTEIEALEHINSMEFDDTKDFAYQDTMYVVYKNRTYIIKSCTKGAVSLSKLAIEHLYESEVCYTTLLALTRAIIDS